MDVTCRLPFLHCLLDFAQTHVPLSQWCHPTTSSSVTQFFFCLLSFQAPGSFPMSWLFASGSQSIGALASASVLPMNIQGWLPLGWTGLTSVLCKGLSGVFSSTPIRAPCGPYWSQYLWKLRRQRLCLWSVTQLCLTLWDRMDYNLPGSSVHRIFRARILECVAIFSSRGSSWPSDRTCISWVSCIGKWILYHWATWEAP